LRRVAASAAVDLLRNELARRLREERVARSRAEAGDFLEQAALLEHARRELDALRSLAHEDRALLELRIRMEGAIAPIAAALGLGMPALDSRLRRASERARRALQGVAR
jgi:DNA-directed RNA polymerase specialized sigma24 family protein